MIESLDVAAFFASAEELRGRINRYDRRRMALAAKCFSVDELVCWQAHVLVVPTLAPATTRQIIARLEERAEAEGKRGRSGHWTYSPAEHAALLEALRAEREILAWQLAWGAKLLGTDTLEPAEKIQMSGARARTFAQGTR